MVDHVGKIANSFYMIYAMSSWLLATCSWHDRANYFPNPLIFR